MSDVADASTVSLIDTTTDTTVATTVTNASGLFSLSFLSWSPTAGDVYYLEAVKGLSNNLAGNDAARVRTLIEFTSGSWQSISVGGIDITPQTTALSIIESLQGTTAVPPATLINTVLGSTYSGSPDVSQADFNTVTTMVNGILTANGDPIAGVTYSGGQYQESLGAGGVQINAASPSAGPAGTVVTLSGDGFSTTLASDSVLFNGVASAISTASATTLTTTVPAGAMTGPITIWVQTASGSQGTVGLTFTITGALTGTVASQSAGTITGAVPLQ